MPRITSPVLTLASCVVCSTPAFAQQFAEYAVTLDAEWSLATHPTEFPPDPHFSPIIGATHTPSISLWQPGGLATNGIERMAETGSPTSLRNEVNGHIAFGDADQFINLGGIAISPGARDGTITADAGFPILSLVTMIAPSPDWFVGIHGVDLRPGGVWARELVFDLDPYDSGTDAGLSYQSPNADITPHLPIANLAGTAPFAGHGRIGTLRITLLSEAGCSQSDLAEPYGVLDLQDLAAFASAFVNQDAAADLTGDSILDLDDIQAFIASFAAGCP